ncbi:hypothetical protein ACOSQ4_030743 [Xanthoceras sorbifolium]
MSGAGEREVQCEERRTGDRIAVGGTAAVSQGDERRGLTVMSGAGKREVQCEEQCKGGGIVAGGTAAVLQGDKQR